MYKVPSESTGVNISEDLKFPSESFILNPSDREVIDYIMLPEGLIRSRTEALAHEIVESWKRHDVTEVHVLVVMNGAFHFYSHLMQTLNELVCHTQPRIFMIPQFVKLSSYINT